LTQNEPSVETLTLVLGAALCTEMIGVHALFGGFLAGTVMPDSEVFRRRVGACVERFSSVLLSAPAPSVTKTPSARHADPSLRGT
jgi:Kef-type K+ transport system membrane component KefB